MLMLPTNDDRDASEAFSRPNGGGWRMAVRREDCLRGATNLVARDPGFRT
jgi:hypothetical protein